MAKDKKQNGGFQQKISDDELQKLVKSGVSGQELVEKTGMKSYSLQSRLYNLALKTKDVNFIIDFPQDVSTTVQRKERGINLSKALCENFSVAPGTKFEVSPHKKSGGLLLKPVK